MGIYANWINDVLPDISAIQRAVADWFNMPLEELLGEDRYRPIALRRHLAIYLCAKAIGRRDNDIGRAFNRDRAMIPRSIERINKIIETDPEFAEIVRGLMKEVGITKKDKPSLCDLAQRRQRS